MRKFKKASAIILAVAMLFTLMSVNVFAADSTVNVHYILEATEVVDGQFTLNVYVADDASGTIQNADGYYLAMTQLELTYDNTAVTVTDASARKNAYYGGITIDGGLIQMASLNQAGTEFSGKAAPAAIFTCAVADSSKASVTFTPQNMLAMDENSDNVPNALIHANPLTVSFGGAAPDPTATPDVVPTDAPTAKPTAEPTATPVPMVKANIPSPRVGKDYTVSVTRTDSNKAGTIKVVLKNAAGKELVGEATFAEGATKADVTFTSEQIASIVETGESFNVKVSYDGQDIEAEEWTEDVTLRPAGGHSGNSGFSTTPDGVATSTPAPGPGTEPTATPAAEQPTTAPVETSVFTDVPASHWAYSYIMDLYEDGIVNGVSATQFMPDANVTRAEFTKMAAGIFGLTATSATSQFVDVPAGEWYTQSVIAATEAGIVQGISDTEFGPEENITREQMAAIIGRQLGMTSSAAITYRDSASIEEYAVPYVAALTEAGYLTGDNGQFNPKANATRAEAATLLDRVYVATSAPEATEAPEATAEPEATTEPEAEATAEPEAEATATPEAE